MMKNQLNQKSQKQNKFKKFLVDLGIFFTKGLVGGRWEIKFTWKF